MQLTANDVAQHSPLVLYLGLVAFLSIRLFPRPPYSKTALLFVITALIALATTWTYMIKFMLYSYTSGRVLAGPKGLEYNTTVWLEQTSLFDQAWRYVCATPGRWWISSQLCTFTVGLWTVFLYAEASRRPQFEHLAWQYMILGQIVAISFASSLFLAKLSLPRHRAQTRARAGSTRLLEISVFIALATVLIVPATVTGPAFLPNLLAMHAIIVLPLIQLARGSSQMTDTVERKNSPQAMQSRNFKQLYFAAAAAALLLHVKNNWPVFASVNSLEEFGKVFWSTVNLHPAQSSISWDVMCTNAIWQLWSWLEVYRLKREGRIEWIDAIKGAGVVGLTPTIGSASSIGFFLGLREEWLARPASTAKEA